MQIELLFLLIATIGTIVYAGYMKKNRKPTPKPEQQPQTPTIQQDTTEIKKLEEKYIKLNDEMHDLKIAWKLKPAENQENKVANEKQTIKEKKPKMKADKL